MTNESTWRKNQIFSEKLAKQLIKLVRKNKQILCRVVEIWIINNTIQAIILSKDKGRSRVNYSITYSEGDVTLYFDIGRLYEDTKHEIFHLADPNSYEKIVKSIEKYTIYAQKEISTKKTLLGWMP